MPVTEKHLMSWINGSNENINVATNTILTFFKINEFSLSKYSSINNINKTVPIDVKKGPKLA